MTWQEQHEAIIKGVEEISPTFANNVRKLDSMGRILWEKMKDEKDEEFFHVPVVMDGGFEIKPTIQMVYQPVSRW